MWRRARLAVGLESWAAFSASFHVSAYGDSQAQPLNGQAAQDEACARGSIRPRKENKSGDGEKETGWHDQQSGKFHGRSLFKFRLGSDSRLRIRSGAEAHLIWLLLCTG
jgi:hypothetical protein